jgi:hypothetical protein
MMVSNGLPAVPLGSPSSLKYESTPFSVLS